LQPLFDYVLASVLHGDESGHIILQAALNDSRTKRFSNRLKQTLEAVFCPDNDNTANCVMSELALKRIHFIPRVQSDQMAAVLSLGTVVLHPFPFGGSKTAFDALLAAVPLVTFPQPYLRGRMAASFFITMELHTFDPSVGASVCCVASSISDYVSKSIRLGNDKIYRDKVIVALKARNHRISDDKQTSFEWARFLARAMGVGLSKRELTHDLGYYSHPWQKDDFLASSILKEQKRWRRASSISTFGDI